MVGLRASGPASHRREELAPLRCVVIPPGAAVWLETTWEQNNLAVFNVPSPNPEATGLTERWVGGGFFFGKLVFFRLWKTIKRRTTNE